MEKDLNDLEKSILEKLAVKYLFIKEHIPFLRVKRRENTGVGMYVNFIYKNPPSTLKNIYPGNTALSTNENIIIDGLKYGLGYEVAISNGRINFIEFITYDNELWDGTFKEFHFESIF